MPQPRQTPAALTIKSTNQSRRDQFIPVQRGERHQPIGGGAQTRLRPSGSMHRPTLGWGRERELDRLVLSDLTSPAALCFFGRSSFAPLSFVHSSVYPFVLDSDSEGHGMLRRVPSDERARRGAALSHACEGMLEKIGRHSFHARTSRCTLLPGRSQSRSSLR